MIVEEENQKTFTIAKLIPNIVTITALCCGMFSIRLSIAGNYTEAAIYIIIACLLDAVDGNIARRLNASSELGAQMDSMADLINFGVAPGFFVYFWKMQEFDSIRYIAWAPTLLLATCMALRLARFNVALTTEDPNNPLVKYFFTGCPAPMDALLILFPFGIATEFNLNIHPALIIISTLVVAFLTVSKIPTITPKKMKIKNEYKGFVLLLFAVLTIGVIVRIWLTLTIFLTIYLLSIVFGWFWYAKLKKELKK